MKIAYNSWGPNRWERHSCFDIRELSGTNCTRVVVFEEDLVWTNLSKCKGCASLHFSKRWRWAKGGVQAKKGNGSYLPMVKMQAKAFVGRTPRKGWEV